MSYGISRFDFGKGVALLSCSFHVAMIYWIAYDVNGVITSPYGGGWWDPLQSIVTRASAANNNSDRMMVAACAGIYPRQWATFLLFQLVVRLNWIFTTESSPALFRCVLLTYALPLGQYAMECWYFETLPSMDPMVAMSMIVPWLVLLTGYTKYTTTQIQDPAAGTDKRKQT